MCCAEPVARTSICRWFSNRWHFAHELPARLSLHDAMYPCKIKCYPLLFVAWCRSSLNKSTVAFGRNTRHQSKFDVVPFPGRNVLRPPRAHGGKRCVPVSPRRSMLRPPFPRRSALCRPVAPEERRVCPIAPAEHPVFPPLPGGMRCVPRPHPPPRRNDLRQRNHNTVH